jgi:hypothetical protein
MKSRGWVAIVAVILSVTAVVFAQSQTGRITGRIGDPSGAAVAGAEVIATDEATGVATKGSSSATAAAPLLESTTSGVGQFIEAKSVTDMPLNGRRAPALVALSAATVWVSYGGAAKPNFSLAGGRAQSQMFWLDGGAGQNMRLGVGQVDIDPPVEVIREFRVVQNTYSAEFGGSAGGLIVSTTKSGTNEFHGSLFEYFRNDKMDARNFFAADKPPLRYLFGGTLGGPVIPNRTHFFGGYDGTRRSTALVDILTAPTAAQRRGDFSQTTNAARVLTRIFDPSTNTVAGGRNVRQQFPGNHIPASRLDPVAVKVAEFYDLRVFIRSAAGQRASRSEPAEFREAAGPLVRHHRLRASPAVHLRQCRPRHPLGGWPCPLRLLSGQEFRLHRSGVRAVPG